MAKRYKASRSSRLAQRRYRRKRSQYEDYLEKFQARKKILHERGIEMYDPTALTFKQWKTERAEKVNDLKLDIKEGKRKSIGDVNRELVSDQAYELSSRQASVLADYLTNNEYDYLEEMGLAYKYTDEQGVERINLKNKIELFMKIRQGEFVREDLGLWDLISDYRQNLFAKGMNKEEVRRAVGQTFFNSPD